MTRALFILFLTVLPSLIFGQSDEQYKPIYKLGWDMINFSAPDNLAEQDTGEINYLVSLNKKGKIKRIEILTNSFSREAEKKWRNEVKKVTFTRQKQHQGPIEYKGIFQISRGRCSDSDLEAMND